MIFDSDDGRNDLIPDHTVALGDPENTAGDGKAGRRERATVTITLNDDTETFRSAVEIDPSPFGDEVVVESVPAKLEVEILGCCAELDGDNIAGGVYTWTSQGERRHPEQTRRVTFVQIVPCPTCSGTVDRRGAKTPLGRICGKCAKDFDVADRGREGRR
jgi:hypothetical protein